MIRVLMIISLLGKMRLHEDFWTLVFALWKGTISFVEGQKCRERPRRIDVNVSLCEQTNYSRGQAERETSVWRKYLYIFQAPMSLPHPTTLTSIHASLPHFLPSPALASPVGSPSSQPNIAVSNAQCSTLFVANLGQFVSEHELKDIFSRLDILHPYFIIPLVVVREQTGYGCIFALIDLVYLYIVRPTYIWSSRI